MKTSLAPIVVDLDDTLIKTDLFFESALIFIKRNPLRFFSVLYWALTQSREFLKCQIAEKVDLNVKTLPLNHELIAWLKEKKHQGHELILATASHHKYANQIAEQLGIFDRVLATDRHVNLKASHKEKRLVELFGDKGFTYVGDSKADLKVWRSAESAVFVGSSEELKSEVEALTRIEKQFPKPNNKASIFSAMRVHQWVKNALIFVPLFTSHNVKDPGLLAVATLAFLAFSLCASAVYILNDLFDLEDDRKHRTKYKRAFASGQMSIVHGGALFTLCLLSAFVISLMIGTDFFMVLVVYFFTTLLYSLYFKALMMIDIVVLAALYTLRIIAGAVAIGVELSFWLLAFSMFLFLSLAIMKRFIELNAMKESGQDDNAKARGYLVKDIDMLSTLGTANGCIAVLIMAFYVNSTEITVLYSQPELLWLACLVLLFWIGRAWLDASRGNVNDDPILYVIKDKVSWLCGAIMLTVFWMAI